MAPFSEPTGKVSHPGGNLEKSSRKRSAARRGQARRTGARSEEILMTDIVAKSGLQFLQRYDAINV
jgi:hypothetical protein